MEQKESNNEEKKQNAEEEEFDEEDEEEKEQEKEQNNDNNNNNEKEKEKEKTEEQNTKSTENKEHEPNTSENKERTEEKVEENNDKVEKKEESNVVKKEEKEEKNNEKEKEKEKDIIIDKKESEENMQEEEEEEEEEEDKESTTTYILKYTRKDNEPRESSYDKELIKPKNCLYMIEFKIMQGKKETYLLVYCHEIAAIYFDEIYEKKYSLKDLYKENRHFRIFDDVKEAKNIIDEILKNNTKNTKKIFIDVQDNTFRLHLNMIFFDKETEIIFNITKKNITDKERIRLLPGFLKEIQIKMNHLEQDNKKYKKNDNKNLNESGILGSTGKLNIEGLDESDFIFQKNNSSKKLKSINEKGYKKKLIKK